MIGSTLITLVLAALTGMLLSRVTICFMHAGKSAAFGDFGPFVRVLVTVAAATLAFDLSGRAGMHARAPWIWPTTMTVFGAVLFGIGARINGSCTIGTFGRLAHGDIGALATFVGGGLAAFLLPHMKVVDQAPSWIAAAGLWWTIAVILIALGGVALLTSRSQRPERLLEVLALGSVAALLYAARGQTSLLDAAAAAVEQGRMHMQGVAVALGLLAGGVLVALLTGTFQLSLPRPGRIPFELLGGALMTSGALLIPGASDVIAFYGLPSGSPHAVLAWIFVFLTVVATFRLTESPVWRRTFPPTEA